MADANKVRAEHKEFLFPCVANYYDEPVVLVRAEGNHAFDADGRDYLDFFGGILTVSVGHCHPEVVERVHQQMQTLGHVSAVYGTEGQVNVAKKLARLTPGTLKKSFFTNSGTEADETAVMLAKIYTGQQEIIVLRHSYHGRSALNISMTSHAPWRPVTTQVPGIKHALSPYCYRCPFGQTYPDCGIKCATDLEELIRTETNGRPAAFIAEPIQGVGGFITPPKEYFEVAVGIVRKYGGIFICDEVQTGFGRTGDKWFGIEHFGVEPEIMTMAKGIANGWPVGATIATEAVANAFTSLSLSTYGGNPVSMAAAEATIDIMERENIPKRSAELGAILRAALDEMKERYDFIGDVRGMGLMQGVELVESRATKEPSPKKAVRFMEATKRQGILVGKGGLYGNVLRIAPPMMIDKSELLEGIKRLDAAFGEVKYHD